MGCLLLMVVGGYSTLLDMDSLIHSLCNVGSNEFAKAWGLLFFDPIQVRELEEGIAQEDDPGRWHQQLLSAGGSWDGSGWTTS